jgi:hypothetical protein
MASLPLGAKPDTAKVAGPAGSSLVIVIVALLGPNDVGWKRNMSETAFPAAMTRGKMATSGTRSSPEEEEIPVTVSLHRPLLDRSNGLSVQSPTQV